MTRERKVFFITLLVLVAVLLLNVGMYIKKGHHVINNDINLQSSNEDVIKAVDVLKKRLAKIFAQEKYSQHLPKPGNGVVASVHKQHPKKNYEDAWIDDIDDEKEIVLVRTIDSKILIIFKPLSNDFKKFHKGSISAVTFECTKLKKGRCDFKAPYKLFVSNGLVEVKELILPKK